MIQVHDDGIVVWLDGFNKVVDKLADTKIELADRLSNMRVELVRWSFAFWLGQIPGHRGDSACADSVS